MPLTAPPFPEISRPLTDATAPMFIAGVLASQADEPRTPPAIYTPEEQQAWIDGYDS